jgi:hypothetical protein
MCEAWVAQEVAADSADSLPSCGERQGWGSVLWHSRATWAPLPSPPPQSEGGHAPAFAATSEV